MVRIFGFCMFTLIAFSACQSNTENSTKKQLIEIMNQLKITRHFDVEPAEVFKAFTSPDEMIVWWTPDTEFDIDLKNGGRYTITRMDGETKLVMTGRYLKVEEPNKLVYTCSMPDFSPIIDTISIEIQPDENSGSKMTFIQEGEGIREELSQLSEGTISQSETGWNQGFDLMVEAWKQIND